MDQRFLDPPAPDLRTPPARRGPGTCDDVELFDSGSPSVSPPPGGKNTPLAERMRPARLDDVLGQEHLLGPGKLLRGMADTGRLQSLIFWGPPGCGKTTLARLMADACHAHCIHLSAVTSGTGDIRKILPDARRLQRGTVPVAVLVDEIHHFNKSQQDTFLPHVEAGLLTLIGATTENPSFELISPLLSRCRVCVMHPLTEETLAQVVDRALAERGRGLWDASPDITAEARQALARRAHGDARVALNALESAVTLARNSSGTGPIDLAHVEQALQLGPLRYDRAGEEHYNLTSAFIKSLRGSDPDAAVYWMVRMVEAGEEPLFIARRMVIFAAEDVGNADPQALQVAVAAKDAVHFVGLPEGRIPMTQAAIYLATAPKSNSAYRALLAATRDVRELGALPTPLHLRNAPTGLMKSLGYGADYRYPHDEPGHVGTQEYLPSELEGRRYYEPGDQGYEEVVRERLESWKALRKRNEPG